MIDTYIVQGSTPFFQYEFDELDANLLDEENYQTIVVSFEDEKGTCVEKKLVQGNETQEIFIEEKVLCVRLSQKDTLSFREGTSVEIQLKILKKNGEVLVGDSYYALVRKGLNKEVLE